MNPHYSFVIPLFNESEVFENLIRRMNELLSRIESSCEVLLVDDGSTDGTRLLLESLALEDDRYHCIFLSRNFGHQIALTVGLDYARGDYIMILDADLQDPPELFFEFLEQIKKGYEVVFGVRKKRKEGLLKRISYGVFYKILTRITDHPIPEDSGDFCMISRKAAKAILANREEGRFIRGLRSWVGFKQIGVAYERQKRDSGEPKYTLSKLIKLAYDGFFNFSSTPIKLITLTGLLCLTITFMYSAIALYRKIRFGDVPSGFTSLLILQLLFGGFQFISLGILGEYLYRIFFQVKNRPLYVIDKRIVGKIELDE